MALMYPGVRLLLMVVGLGFGFINGAQAAGAGRAFPIESENYVIEEFQRINPNLKWDRTNFLTDLSGQYANCDSIRASGKVRIERTTPEGDSIAGYNDHKKDGRGFHVDAVNVDLKIVIDRWIETIVLHRQIMVARRFGCSVRPGCNGNVVAVNCLFSPADDGIWPTRSSTTHQYTQPSITRQSTQPSTTSQHIQLSTTSHHIQPSTTSQTFSPELLRLSALAFTREQYRVAEEYINNKWDGTHYLENLSGRETNCTMIGSAHWQFTKAKSFNPRLNFTGIFGYEEHDGTTEGPLRKILTYLSQNMTVSSSSEFGCSLITDCKLPNGTVYVVVSCIFRH